jgi:hypothetical protein
MLAVAAKRGKEILLEDLRKVPASARTAQGKQPVNHICSLHSARRIVKRMSGRDGLPAFCRKALGSSNRHVQATTVAN